jgi:hypothetical protein
VGVVFSFMFPHVVIDTVSRYLKMVGAGITGLMFQRPIRRTGRKCAATGDLPFPRIHLSQWTSDSLAFAANEGSHAGTCLDEPAVARRLSNRAPYPFGEIPTAESLTRDNLAMQRARWVVEKRVWT